MPDSPDPLIGELHRAARDRRILSISAAVGIILGAILGLLFIVLAFTNTTTTAFYRHRAHLFVLGAPLLSITIGYALYSLRRRRR